MREPPASRSVNPSMGQTRQRWTYPLHDRLTGLALLAFIGLFVAYPNLDLMISAWFYNPTQAVFIWAHHPVVRFLYLWTPWLGRALVVLLLIKLVYRRRYPQRAKSASQRIACLTLCVALLGPGLLIEGILKPYWQRPRPVQIEQFGGDHVYVPPFQRCATCTHHHAFVSSHAATGYALLALGLVASAALKRRWFAISLVTGSLIGLGRIAQGGHFFSDIVFAFFSVWLVAKLVQAIFWKISSA